MLQRFIFLLLSAMPKPKSVAKAKAAPAVETRKRPAANAAERDDVPDEVEIVCADGGEWRQTCFRYFVAEETPAAAEANPRAVQLFNRFNNWNNTVLDAVVKCGLCLLYTSPSPRDRQKSRMPSSA